MSAHARRKHRRAAERDTARERERGIIFKDRLVRAIIAQAKTETRRVMMPQPTPAVTHGWLWAVSTRPGANVVRVSHPSDLVDRCPYGRPGDKLYVRETWSPDHKDVYPCVPAVYRADDYPSPHDLSDHVADCRHEQGGPRHFECLRCADFRWRPSIHMPRWAARAFMALAEVRVEPVSWIDDAGALAEGIEFAAGMDLFGRGETTREEILERPRGAFLALWDAINGPRGMGVEANPWVWVLRWPEESIEVRHG